MAMELPDGRGTETPMGRFSQAGENLSPRQVRRYRDLLGVLLIEGVGLSPTDAARVLSQGASRDHLTKRLKKVPDPVKSRFQKGALRELLHGR
jgi:hypothetical protein